MKKVETHVHTDYSMCSAQSAKKVVDTAVKKGIDTLFIKDHGTVKGALEAKKYQEKYGLPVVIEIGIEPRTEFGEIGIDCLENYEGEILEELGDKGKFKFEDISRYVQEFRKTNSRLLTCLHHPFNFSFGNKRGGFDFRIVRGVEYATGKEPVNPLFNSLEELAKFFDYVELNANNLNAKEGEYAIRFANEFGLPGVLSSDAHFPWMIGRNFSFYYGDNARDSIKEGKIIIPKNPNQIRYFESRVNRTLSGFIRPVRKMFSELFSEENLRFLGESSFKTYLS